MCQCVAQMHKSWPQRGFCGLQGLRYGDLFKYFADATVMGLFEPGARSVRINPHPDELVGVGDELILMRPTSAAAAEYQPLDVPVLTDPGAYSFTSCVCPF